MDEYRSLLAPYMQSFLQYRKALFHKNSAYEPVLHSLDRFCADNFPDAAYLSKEMVLAWMERTSMPRSGRSIRGAIIRKFAAYMNGIGGAAYVLPEKMYGSNTSFVPYIFTDAEMQRLFVAIDSIRPSALQPHKHVVLPVMFRLIYTCGLRPAEARVLPANNVYLDSGEILITETKRSRDRMIVMSEDMRTLCADYNEQRKVLFPDSPFFFPGTDGKAFASATVSREFCKCWAKANPDVPKENLPDVRVYDLRHRFASAAVQRWLYDTGARIQELLNVRICDIQFAKSPTVQVLGKGGKYRFIPIMPKTVEHLRRYMELFHPGKLLPKRGYGMPLMAKMLYRLICVQSLHFHGCTG